MKITLFLLIVFLMSCQTGTEKANAALEDSLIESNKIKIEQLQKNGDSIEKVNTSGKRKIQ